MSLKETPKTERRNQRGPYTPRVDPSALSNALEQEIGDHAVSERVGQEQPPRRAGLHYRPAHLQGHHLGQLRHPATPHRGDHRGEAGRHSLERTRRPPQRAALQHRLLPVLNRELRELQGSCGELRLRGVLSARIPGRGVQGGLRVGEPFRLRGRHPVKTQQGLAKDA
jgi:hypothetical protein